MLWNALWLAACVYPCMATAVSVHMQAPYSGAHVFLRQMTYRGYVTGIAGEMPPAYFIARSGSCS